MVRKVHRPDGGLRHTRAESGRQYAAFIAKGVEAPDRCHPATGYRCFSVSIDKATAGGGNLPPARHLAAVDPSFGSHHAQQIGLASMHYVGNIVKGFQRYFRIRRARRALAQLPDHALKDIGIGRAEIDAATARGRTRDESRAA